MKTGRTPSLVSGPFLCLLLLAGCGRGDVPTSAENRQLDNSEAMLDAAPDTLNAIDGNALDEPAENGAAPG